MDRAITPLIRVDVAAVTYVQLYFAPTAVVNAWAAISSDAVN